MLIAVPEISSADHFAPLKTRLGGKGLEGDVSDVSAAGHTAGVDGIPLILGGEEGGVGINITGDGAAGEFGNFVSEDLHGFAVPVGAECVCGENQIDFRVFGDIFSEGGSAEGDYHCQCKKKCEGLFHRFFLLLKK